ncbi:hypothetical protein FQZ97_542610 [compost metagenome]
MTICGKYAMLSLAVWLISLPCAGLMLPVMMSNRVDFPAPFSPSKPMIFPLSIRKDSFFRTSFSEYPLIQSRYP